MKRIGIGWKINLALLLTVVCAISFLLAWELVVPKGKNEANTMLAVAAVVLTLILLVAGLFVRRHIVGPLIQLVNIAHQLSEGGPPNKVPSTKRTDEIGRLANAIEVFRRSQITSQALLRSAELAFIDREREPKCFCD